MEATLLIVLLGVLAILWFVLSNRIEELQLQINRVSLDANDSSQIARLVERVAVLEREMKRSTIAPPVPVEAPDIELPVVVKVAPPPLPPEPAPVLVEAEPEIESVFVAEALPQPEPEAVQAPEQSPAPSPKKSSAEWEATVGGNWLNKLGVFILVMGVALFLGYSFTQFGPIGRATIALAVSGTLLATGVFVERRERYRIFARGLIGGGWAALYFTTYALQAIDAAKVIYNPLLGGVLLLAVAGGMILHSLRYHSQTVTGLAYFVAFATLAITSVTPFSVVALIPLAASLLFVAYRFEWSEMALLGLVATYGTCASRGDSGAPIWQAQTLFSVYWLLFEGFDLFRAARRSDRGAERAIFPLNALAFTTLSYAKWSAAAPHQLYLLAAGIGAAYLASTAIRCWFRPPSSFAPESTTLERILGGGYEGPVTLTALLSAAAVLLKFHGGWATGALLAQAELLFLAGLFFREQYLRQLAASLFAVAIGKIVGLDIGAEGTWVFAGRTFEAWTPSAAAAAVLFYINRALRKSDIFYGYAAVGALALIIGFESPQRYLGMNWLLLAALVFAFGWLRRLQDFRFQGYASGALGGCGIAIHQLNVAGGYSAASPHPWIALSSGAVVAYGAVVCALRSGADRFSDLERSALKVIASWAATAALMALVWRVAPDQYLGVAWIGLALVILELGIRGVPEEFRRQSYVAFVAGAAWVVLVNVIPVHNDGPVRERLTLAFAALLAYAFAARVHIARAVSVPQGEVEVTTDAASATGTGFALTALWALLPGEAVGPAWAALGLLLLEAGISFDLPGLRMQAHAAGAATIARLFLANFTGLGYTAGISHRLLTVVPVAVAQYFAWFRQRGESARLVEWERLVARFYLYSGATLIAVLLRFELGRSQVAGGWALLALALIALGQRFNLEDLRWQSYAIAALAFFRSWTTDFYDPASLAGAPLRIAIGAGVVACFFVAQLLLPQSRPRLFYSLLSTVLLTVVLYHEVSGGMLTVAGGAEAVALLITGFPLRDRTLRWSGLALFLVCILKLFFYDLRQLETMPRILSFIALGLILVAVSWVYTRFREQLQRYL